ncbi:MAG: ROK family protein [Chthoniobacteraceae bacterium]
MSKPNTAIGIDFGGTSIKAAIVCDGKIVQRGEVIETLDHDAQSLTVALFDLIKTLRAANPEIAGVGVGMPGFVDSLHGVVHHLTNVEGWDDVPLAKLITDATGLPAIVENDVKAMTYGEWKYGAARGVQHAVCVTLGTGVGGGLIMSGRLHRGAQFAAGEIGHASIDYRGKDGPYGNYGGLEEYVGNQQIAERAVALYRVAGRPRTLEQCSPRELDRLAHEGDSIANGLWETVGLEIGAALANVVWIVNPEVIVIGGGVAKAGDLLFEPIRRSIASRTVKLFHENLRIVPAALGNDAGIVGNAALVLDSLG